MKTFLIGLKPTFLIICTFCALISCLSQDMKVFRSSLSVEETVSKMELVIEGKGLESFETVWHDKIAAKEGLELEATEIIMFEDPKLTTELIICEQTAALDLPLKVLIWEENGDTYIGYFDPIHLRRKFLIDGCDETLKGLSALVARVVNETLRGN